MDEKLANAIGILTTIIETKIKDLQSIITILEMSDKLNDLEYVDRARDLYYEMLQKAETILTKDSFHE